MKTVKCSELGTLRRRERDAAAAVALACVAVLALIGAGCILAACLVVCNC